MRVSALVLICLAAIACERNDAVTTPANGQAASEQSVFEAPVSDELPGLPAPATGIAFWDHPTLSFNSTMIVATSNGVIAYSMEDGNEVSRIDGFEASGVATGYLGYGAAAAGFVAFLDAEENAFKFYGIDNASRAFLPLAPGPAIRRPVRSFCLGRSASASAPSLYVIQRGGVQAFNLAAATDGVRVENETFIETPGNLVSCAVGGGGELFVGDDSGGIFKLAGDNAFKTPFARTNALNNSLNYLSARRDETASDLENQLVVADLSSGVVHFLNEATGASIGSVKIVATDDLPGVDSAETFSLTGGNLGGLYRNGVAAFGVAAGSDGPVIRIAPVSSLKNALSLNVGEPVSPRGENPSDSGDTLIIPIEIQTERE